jgi:hypothetical protein
MPQFGVTTGTNNSLSDKYNISTKQSVYQYVYNLAPIFRSKYVWPARKQLVPCTEDPQRPPGGAHSLGTSDLNDLLYFSILLP